MRGSFIHHSIASRWQEPSRQQAAVEDKKLGISRAVRSRHCAALSLGLDFRKSGNFYLPAPRDFEPLGSKLIRLSNDLVFGHFASQLCFDYYQSALE